nr:hypothetical protein [Megavirus caiporensis]
MAPAIITNKKSANSVYFINIIILIIFYIMLSILTFYINICILCKFNNEFRFN